MTRSNSLRIGHEVEVLHGVAVHRYQRSGAEPGSSVERDGASAVTVESVLSGPNGAYILHTGAHGETASNCLAIGYGEAVAFLRDKEAAGSNPVTPIGREAANREERVESRK
jgi:hypothetical protein